MLSGVKTYLVAIAIGLLTTLHALGLITDQVLQLLLGLLGSLGLATLRAGVQKAENKAETAARSAEIAANAAAETAAKVALASGTKPKGGHS